MRWRKSRQLRFLREAPVIRVATVSRRGRPQVTPVCHAEWQGRIYWASDPDAVKLTNLSHRRWVALVARNSRSAAVTSAQRIGQCAHPPS